MILAGITIASLTGSGLFEKVKLAKQKTENAQNEENVTIAQYENSIDKYIGNNRETIEIDKNEYLQLLNDVEQLKANNTLKTSKFSIIFERIKGNKFF